MSEPMDEHVHIPVGEPGSDVEIQVNDLLNILGQQIARLEIANAHAQLIINTLQAENRSLREQVEAKSPSGNPPQQ